jgi:hypothetical protein
MLRTLDMSTIDAPIAAVVKGFNGLPQCFTLQSCYGHFLCSQDQDSRTLDRLPGEHSGEVRYRIAYMAFCVENSRSGREFRAALEALPGIDPEYIQFGSADWFWERYLNSYVLQVEPVRFKMKDEALIGYGEALRIEKVRDLFYKRVEGLLRDLCT